MPAEPSDPPALPALRVWVLSDGRPGHFNQAKGVLRALERHYAVDARWIDLRLRLAAWRLPLGWWLNRRADPGPAGRLGLFYRLDALPAERPDLIVSAGGNTLYANAWLGRALGVRNLFVGDIRRLRPRCFWRVLSYCRRQPSPPFLHWPITPVPIVGEELAARGAAFRAEHGLAGQPLWTVLVGGDGGGYRYDRQDWDNLVQWLARSGKSEGVRWLVVTGRRSGAEIERLLAEKTGAAWVAAISLYSREQGSRYMDFLAAGDRLVCTEDSHMMLTEAISAGKPVLAVRPADARPQPTNRQFLEMYEQGGYLQRQTLADLAKGNATWQAARPSGFVSPLAGLGDLLRGCLAEADDDRRQRGP